ncbi:MAG: protease modulator HflC [Micavibrio sp.]|nr:protease modulator HflC [Micavibrio sp.]|tara:strand:- start:1151 stop:2113 length:963 start_codon:yes stop_codon:yes gene_type:complete
MNIGKLSLGLLFVAALGLIVVSMSMFIVDEREQAIVLQFGQPMGEINGPGLHFKVPVIQNVRYFDRRILSIDPGPEQMVISSSNVNNRKMIEEAEEALEEGDIPPIESVSGEPIIVDTFARYRITDPLQFLKTLRTVSNANSRLGDILKDSTKSILGKTTLQDLLSDRRTSVMADIQKSVNAKIKEDRLGISIIDVRIVRADLTADLRTSTVRRMISELKERATETRAKGEEQALEIRSTAEKERTVLIAEAQRDAQKLKGQGDKEAITIYADAFNKDEEFYAFTRSLEAYRATLANPDTQLILSPDSDFFRYFQERGSR